MGNSIPYHNWDINLQKIIDNFNVDIIYRIIILYTKNKTIKTQVMKKKLLIVVMMLFFMASLSEAQVQYVIKIDLATSNYEKTEKVLEYRYFNTQKLVVDQLKIKGNGVVVEVQEHKSKCRWEVCYEGIIAWLLSVMVSLVLGIGIENPSKHYQYLNWTVSQYRIRFIGYMICNALIVILILLSFAWFITIAYQYGSYWTLVSALISSVVIFALGTGLSVLKPYR